MKSIKKTILPQSIFELDAQVILDLGGFVCGKCILEEVESLGVVKVEGNVSIFQGLFGLQVHVAAENGKIACFNIRRVVRAMGELVQPVTESYELKLMQVIPLTKRQNQWLNEYWVRLDNLMPGRMCLEAVAI